MVKQNDSIKTSMSVRLCLFCLILGLTFWMSPKAQANLLRTLALKDLSVNARTASSLAFKGKVLDIKEDASHRIVKFEIQELLRGDAQGKTELELNFRKPKKMAVQGWYQPSLPSFTNGEEAVVFVTRNLNGEDFFIGSEDQSRFHVKTQAGRSFIWNNKGNADFIDSASHAPLMRSIVRDMQSRNEGSVDYEDFKKLLDESEK